MTVSFLTGDCRAILPTLPAGSVQTCVTSPPYFGLRDYGVAGQIGLESSVDAYVAELVAVFAEVRRVLTDDGTLWLNLGDSYAGSWGNYSGQNRGAGKQRPITNGSQAHQKSYDGLETWRPATSLPQGGLKPKDLIGIPWRVAFALQADGWYLRSDIIWHKPNPMPESVTDRPTKAHEYLFLLSKRPTYYYDAEAVKEPAIHAGRIVKASDAATAKNGQKGKYGATALGFTKHDTEVGTGRNRRSVWTVSTKPFKGAHFATFPPDLIEPCIKAGTSERGQCPACGAPWRRIVKTNNPSKWAADGDIRGFNNDGRTANPQSSKSLHRQKGGVYSTAETLGWEPQCRCDAGDPVPQTVLDPFGGAGTTGLVAERLNRSAILIDLNPDYMTLARERIAADAPILARAAD